MPHPFVAAGTTLPHWSGQILFVTTRAVPSSTDKGRASHPVREGRNFMMARRTAIAVIAFGILAAAPLGSDAALDYPTRTVRCVLGYPPGEATDIIARLIGQRLSERLGQQFVIENKPGAGNNIATESVVNAEPDGYTVLLVNPANYINTSLYANLKFNFP